MNKINSIQEIEDQYDLILCDIWGVLFDGDKVFEGVHDCLSLISKKVFLLTNSSQRVTVLEAMLEKLKIYRNTHYQLLISSGEFFCQSVISESLPLKLPAKYYFLGKNHQIIADLPNIERVQNHHDAQMLILAGNILRKNEIEQINPILDDCAEKKLPLFCLNPDMIAMDADKRPVACDGQIANHYQQKLGPVVYMGKPSQSIYQHALKNSITPTPKVLMIGDSYSTDGLGALNSQIDFALVASGVEFHHWQTNNKNMSFEQWIQKQGYQVKWLLNSLN